MLLCRPGWLLIPNNPPVSLSQVLGLQARGTMPSFFLLKEIGFILKLNSVWVWWLTHVTPVLKKMTEEAHKPEAGLG